LHHGLHAGAAVSLGFEPEIILRITVTPSRLDATAWKLAVTVSLWPAARG
jgi:hypothetical protein